MLLLPKITPQNAKDASYVSHKTFCLRRAKSLATPSILLRSEFRTIIRTLWYKGEILKVKKYQNIV